MTRRATGAHDLALAETSWPLPDQPDGFSATIEWRLRYDAPSRSVLLRAADVLAAYRALICDGTTATQTKRLAALRRVWRKRAKP